MEMRYQQVTASFLGDYFAELKKVLNAIHLQPVNHATTILLKAIEDGRSVYIFGNGGSASTASHFACDLSKVAVLNGKARLRVISLADNVAYLTAWANDTDYSNVFAQQIRNLAQAGDVVVAISSSVCSPNIIKAVETADEMGAQTIGFIGFGGTTLSHLVDTCITVPSYNRGIVEDAHLALGHAITAAMHNALQLESVIVGPLYLMSSRKHKANASNANYSLTEKSEIGDNR